MKRIIIAAVVSTLAVLTACSADETDFKQAAEDAAAEAAEDANPDFTAEASCEEPSSTEVGTTFSCTVTYSDGDVQEATAEIRENDEVYVSVAGD